MIRNWQKTCLVLQRMCTYVHVRMFVCMEYVNSGRHMYIRTYVLYIYSIYVHI